jgi:hypothetical protein
MLTRLQDPQQITEVCNLLILTFEVQLNYRVVVSMARLLSSPGSPSRANHHVPLSVAKRDHSVDAPPRLSDQVGQALPGGTSESHSP